ncbi:unnamed protein product, partial [marine sediment metagenome]
YQFAAIVAHANGVRNLMLSVLPGITSAEEMD